ncbi:MAG: ubiquinone/menaquinone biosynthesis methyltransferase [Deltaproteobacteria bacterium]|nr:ubiquinone/menaquinone biosynthesis methyltransferase [Deltaproteobacteria bacterium]
MNPREHGKRVSGLFDSIAGWYDFLNHFLSAGQDLYWRHRLVRTVRPGATGRVLDLAAGTLDVSREILRRHPGQTVLALDFSQAMLCRGQAKIAESPTIIPVQADGRALPLPEACVDTVTIAFGIRNILPRNDAYREILRVLAPGGRLCILEFGTGQARIWRGLYNFYLGTILPQIGRFFSRDPEAYQYLADTIRAFPDARVLAHELLDAGFDAVSYQALSSGIVYVHVARKPVAP